MKRKMSLFFTVLFIFINIFGISGTAFSENDSKDTHFTFDTANKLTMDEQISATTSKGWVAISNIAEGIEFSENNVYFIDKVLNSGSNSCNHLPIYTELGYYGENCTHIYHEFEVTCMYCDYNTTEIKGYLRDAPTH